MTLYNWTVYEQPEETGENNHLKAELKTSPANQDENNTSGATSRIGVDKTHEPLVVGSEITEPLMQVTSQPDERILRMFTDTLNGRSAPPKDEKYLDDSEFHYTSSFKARPQAEFFDFDDRYKYESDIEENLEEEIEERQEILEDDTTETETKEDDLQDTLDKVTFCKAALHDMITKIDDAVLSTISFKNTETNCLEFDEEISDILNLALGSTVFNRLISKPDNIPQSFPLTKEPLRSLSSSSSSLRSLEADSCSRLPNFGVVLIKSPSSVAQLWDEYTKIPSEWPVTDLFTFTLQQGGSNNASNIELITKRQTSIQQLEKHLGSSWRNYDKNFSRQINRRKKIWKAIEEGLNDGLSLQECFTILENYVKERGKGLSWYYNGVPCRLLDMI